MSSNEYVKGTLKTIILKLLAENGQMYGYEITQRVEVLSGKEIILTYGALYPVLHKLEAEGLLASESEVVEGRARKYYTLTPKGAALAKVKVGELQRFTEALARVLSPLPNISLKTSPC